MAMFDWLSRWMGGGAASAVVTAPAARRPAPPAVSKSVTAQSAATAPPAPAFGIKRPLVDARGGVAGFELLLPAALEQRLVAKGDAAAMAAHQALLLVALRPLLAAGRLGVVNLPAAVLARCAAAEQQLAGALFVVPDLAAVPPALASLLRGRGAKLGVPDGPPEQSPNADFVQLQGSAGGLDTLLLSAQRWHEARPRLPLLATRLLQIDDVEHLLQRGFWLAGGQLDRAAANKARPLNAAAHRICELLNHLALDRDTDTVADAVRADVALSYRLLRLRQQPGAGPVAQRRIGRTGRDAAGAQGVGALAGRAADVGRQRPPGGARVCRSRHWRAGGCWNC